MMRSRSFSTSVPSATVSFPYKVSSVTLTLKFHGGPLAWACVYFHTTTTLLPGELH